MIGVLLFTRGHIGTALIEAAERMFIRVLNYPDLVLTGGGSGIVRATTKSPTT